MIQNLKGTTYIFILFLPPVKPKKKSVYIQTLSGFKVPKKKKTKIKKKITSTKHKKHISKFYKSKRKNKIKKDFQEPKPNKILINLYLKKKKKSPTTKS